MFIFLALETPEKSAGMNLFCKFFFSILSIILLIIFFLLDQVTITARLIFDNENINLYNEIDSKNSPIFQQFKDEILQTISIDPKRLIINKKVQYENINDENSVLISIIIKAPDTNNGIINGIERNTDSVLKDLNELIQQKKYNLMSSGTITKFLNENYGVQIIRKHYILYL